MKKAELDKIIKSKNITHCYVLKNGLFYRPNASGYTEYSSKAGIYLKEQAIKMAEKCEELLLLPIDNTNHNKMVLEEIKELSARLINR